MLQRYSPIVAETCFILKGGENILKTFFWTNQFSWENSLATIQKYCKYSKWPTPRFFQFSWILKTKDATIIYRKSRNLLFFQPHFTLIYIVKISAKKHCLVLKRCRILWRFQKWEHLTTKCQRNARYLAFCAMLQKYVAIIMALSEEWKLFFKVR